MTLAMCLVISASSMQSVTGYCLTHHYITIIHFWRERCDPGKEASLPNAFHTFALWAVPASTIADIMSSPLHMAVPHLRPHQIDY